MRQRQRTLCSKGGSTCFLAPQQIQIDQDFAFRGVCEELRRDCGILGYRSLADEHFTDGEIKRRVAEKVFKDLDVQDATGSEGGW